MPFNLIELLSVFFVIFVFSDVSKPEIEWLVDWWRDFSLRRRYSPAHTPPLDGLPNCNSNLVTSFTHTSFFPQKHPYKNQCLHPGFRPHSLVFARLLPFFFDWFCGAVQFGSVFYQEVAAFNCFDQTSAVYLAANLLSDQCQPKWKRHSSLNGVHSICVPYCSRVLMFGRHALSHHWCDIHIFRQRKKKWFRLCFVQSAVV